ncbi:MAG: hypothetical protein FJY21_12470 [Bacteroidetes bacterium]|nr:hypothetical protein [Bacteroidota bacterium]
MPIRDGNESGEKTREKAINLPIIASSAKFPKKIGDENKPIGIDNLVVKPFISDDLSRKVLYNLSK